MTFALRLAPSSVSTTFALTSSSRSSVPRGCIGNDNVIHGGGGGGVGVGVGAGAKARARKLRLELTTACVPREDHKLTNFLLSEKANEHESSGRANQQLPGAAARRVPIRPLKVQSSSGLVAGEGEVSAVRSDGDVKDLFQPVDHPLRGGVTISHGALVPQIARVRIPLKRGDGILVQCRHVHVAAAGAHGQASEAFQPVHEGPFGSEPVFDAALIVQCARLDIPVKEHDTAVVVGRCGHVEMLSVCAKHHGLYAGEDAVWNVVVLVAWYGFSNELELLADCEEKQSTAVARHQVQMPSVRADHRDAARGNVYAARGFCFVIRE
eukprot:scaffold819_cov239-Pinguiococcus_pyrenoidosus.AAC.13